MILRIAICFRAAWLVAILAGMQVPWRTVAHHAALPLCTVLAVGASSGVIYGMRPDDYVNLVLLITAVAIGAGLLVASVLELVTHARHRPLGVPRSIVLAVPAALFVAAVSGLQSMRLVGPLTIGVGLLIVLLSGYVLWPRDEA